MIVVHEDEAEREAVNAYAGRHSDITECAVALIPVQRDAIRGSDDDVVLAVVVIVTHRAAQCFAAGVEARARRDVGELSIAGVSVESDAARPAEHDEIRTAVRIEVDEARTCAEQWKQAIGLSRLRTRIEPEPALCSDRRKPNSEFVGRPVGARDRLRRRVRPLFSVSEADRLPEFRLCELVKTGEVLPGCVAVSRKLVSTRQSELRGYV